MILRTFSVFNPPVSTDTAPGSEARMEVLADRAEHGAPLHAAGDVSLPISYAAFLEAVTPPKKESAPILPAGTADADDAAELLETAIGVARRTARREMNLDSHDVESEAGLVVANLIRRRAEGRLIVRGDITGLLIWLTRRAIFTLYKKRAKKRARFTVVPLFNDKRQPAARVSVNDYRDFLTGQELAVAEAYAAHRSVAEASVLLGMAPADVYRVLREIAERIAPNRRFSTYIHRNAVRRAAA